MKKKLLLYPYILPALIVIGLVVLFPIIYTGYISLTNMNIYHWFDFELTGFKNYEKAFSILNSGFIPAFLLTILWTIVSMAVEMILSFFIAVLLNSEGLRFRNVYKTILMFPWAMPAYVSILLWRMGIFNTEFGLLNQFLRQFGLDNINWLGDSTNAFFSCISVNLWMALPFMIMTIDAALQSIDKSYYESATMEGAGFLAKMIKTTLPSLRPVIAPAVIMTTFSTFKQFDVIYLMTLQKGFNTGANIHTVITYAYDNAFITNNYGYSAAISILIFLIIIVVFPLVAKKSFAKETV